ncbi:MAG: inositol-1-monophosphatase [Pseudomonadota bacterium]|nr:inositol-1-monophosphatase [Pseudomonadota bacterium]
MHPIVNIAIRAARQAGTVITRASNRMDSLNIQTKSPNDFVSEVDRQAEDEIIQTIRKAFPDHSILAEESGEHSAGDEFQWIIDPLDGTTNFLHQFPQYSVSIAVKQRGRLEHAVVFDPLKDEIFSASRGAGAQLNGRRLRVSKANGLEGALLGTGIPFKNQRYLDLYLQMLKTMVIPSAGIRRAGSAALDLAYVASGRLDGFWELDLKPWDMAAGILLIQEAGGMVSDINGGHEIFETGHIIAANPKVFKAMVQALHPYATEIQGL